MMAEDRDRVARELVAFLPNLRRFSIALSGSRDMGDELLQAACERALANADRFRAGTRFDAWMFQIIRNLYIDGLRRRRTAGVEEDIEGRDDLVGESGEQTVEARMTLRSVGEAIAELPVDQREVLILVCVEDLSYREAAALLDIPIGTVMSRLARARLALAKAAGITGDTERTGLTRGRR